MSQNVRALASGAVLLYGWDNPLQSYFASLLVDDEMVKEVGFGGGYPEIDPFIDDVLEVIGEDLVGVRQTLIEQKEAAGPRTSLQERISDIFTHLTLDDMEEYLNSIRSLRGNEEPFNDFGIDIEE